VKKSPEISAFKGIDYKYYTKDDRIIHLYLKIGNKFLISRSDHDLF